MTNLSASRIAKKILKAGVWTISGLLVILLLLVLVLQIPSVQTYLTSQIAEYLQKKIKTRVEVGGVNVAFPKKIVLEDIYVEDQKKDTLLFSHRLAVNIDMLGLTRHSIAINGVELETFTGHINRTLPDSSFNYDFIINAFSDSVTVAKEDTTGKPWQFSIDDVNLKDIYATYKDDISKQNLVLNLGNLDLSFKELDLNKSIYAVDKLAIQHTSVLFESGSLEKPSETKNTQPVDTASSSALPALSFKTISLEDLHIKYYDQPSGLNLKADIGTSEIDANAIDLPTQKLDLNNFSLKNSVVRYQQEARKQELVKSEAKTTINNTSLKDTASGWKVTLADLSLADNHIIYDDFNSLQQTKGFDFAHMLLSYIQIEAEDVAYDKNTIAATINTLKFQEKSGFKLHNLKTKVLLTDTQAEAANLFVQTDNSVLKGDIRSTFQSLSTLSQTYPDMGLDIQIPESKLSVKDLLYFQPNLLKSIPVRITDNKTLHVKTTLKGQVKNLAIKEFQASTFSTTRLNISGHIRNLPDIDRATFQLAILPFETSALDIRTLLPPSMLPSSVRIPQHIQLTSTISGAVHNISTKTQIQTTLGDIIANAHLTTNKSFSNGTYQARVKARNIALGKLIKQDKDIGNLTASATIDGSGFSLKDMKTQIITRIQSVEYKKYTYRNIAIDGLAYPSQFAANISLADTNLNFSLIGSADFRKEIPNYVAVIDMKTANWQKLNFTNRDLSTRARITADLNFKSADYINGNVDIRQVAVASKGKIYTIDSLLYVSVQSKAKTDIKFNSDVLSGYFKGNINWSGLYGALEKHLTRYYALPNAPAYSESEPQNFEFALNLRNTAALTEILLPDVDSLRPGEIRGEFDSRKGQLDLKAQVYSVKYGEIKIDTALFLVESTPKQLKAIFTVEQIKQSSILIRNVSLLTKAAENNLLTQLIIRDSVNKQKYLLGGNFHSLPNNSYSFHFFPDSVKLNYRPWQVAESNDIIISKSGVLFKDLIFTENGQKFSIANVNNQVSSLQAAFTNFRMETLGEIVRSDTSFVSGVLNGQASVVNQAQTSEITADLDIDNFSYTGQRVGDIHLLAQQKEKGRFDVALNLTGNGNKMDVTGFYLSNATENNIDFTATITELNLKSFYPFAQSQLKELSGNATGQFKLQGSTAKPAIQGELVFQNTSFNLKMLDSPFKLTNQAMQLDEEGIHFQKFTIQDQANHNISINGDILTQDYSYYKLQLRINADKFQVLNTKPEDNNMYYGKLITSTTINIRGDSYKPVVNANIKVEGGSNLTYIVPQSDDVVAGREGIVRFVDIGTEQDPFIQSMKSKAVKDTTKSELRGYELTTNIEIDTSSTLNVIIDPVAGDKLSVKGETTLSYTMDPSGNMDLTGRYQVFSGTYSLSFYGLVKREFALNKNSSITWTGDPLNAALDIQATYTVEAPAADLIKNQVSDQRLSQAKQRMPFYVILNLKGVLLKPEISFKLDMPQDKQNAIGGIVYSTLQEINTRESDLNKQVFALFILQRFISDNPFESSSSGIEENVRSSVSKILTDQLNQLANRIQGVELELDVNSYQDYTTGSGQGRTQLELGVSKNLLNDRIVVKVTGNVNLEGSPASSQQDLSNFLGDLQLEYKLTEDGRLRLLGFRKRDFDIVSGQIYKTGAGVIFVRDYNSFKELFSKALAE
ncbi:translocation/assembly module TamB domain-containing protein [Cytophagaceae bacterium YF14B1]|uniref:Translocation/assembly module TamB domain-containing protein n=1 Tax=Xanthocytophaga flava TaxID=3048013 RepID=A0AAE3QMF3_9BACT|nr:translocation/assembly module TamB domain-containing protein [Xanthocytophaga flavus]MDJ1482047.1 translocation/assembly module TamB domain-containing protein [Xanthocytophaga flavus]